MRQTIEVPKTLYAGLRAHLVAAGILSDETAEELSLSQVVVRSRGGPPNTNLVVTSLLSNRTKAGMVDLALNGETTQMDLDKAREVVGMLQGAIEAAVSDQMLYAFLTTRIGLSDAQASAALGNFRELRQGSRGTVFPQ